MRVSVEFTTPWHEKGSALATLPYYIYCLNPWALSLFEMQSIQVDRIPVWDCTSAAGGLTFIFARFSFPSLP